MKKYFFNKRVLITGHTGFKGSWLSLWMHYMGANVLGLSNGNIQIRLIMKFLNLKRKLNQKQLILKILSK